MDYTSIVALVSALAAAVSAVVSVYEARRASSSATDSETILLSLRTEKVGRDLHTLHAVCKRAQLCLAKYGPAFSEKGLRGVDHKKDGEFVQEFLLQLKEQSSLVDKSKPDSVGHFVKQSMGLLDKFTRSKKPAEQLEHGRALLNEISTMSQIIGNRLESNLSNSDRFKKVSP